MRRRVGAVRSPDVHRSEDTTIIRSVRRPPDTTARSSPSSCSWLREQVPENIEKETSVMRKRIALAALSAVAGVGAVAGLAGPASADTLNGYIKRPTTSF